MAISAHQARVNHNERNRARDAANYDSSPIASTTDINGTTINVTINGNNDLFFYNARGTFITAWNRDTFRALAEGMSTLGGNTPIGDRFISPTDARALLDALN